MSALDYQRHALDMPRKNEDAGSDVSADDDDDDDGKKKFESAKMRDI